MFYSLNKIKFLLIIGVCLVSNHCFTQEEHFFKGVKGNIEPGVKILVEDDKLFDLNYGFNVEETNSVKNRISIELDKETLPIDFPSTIFTFNLQILYWDTPPPINVPGAPWSPSIRFETLELSYEPNPLLPSEAKAFVELEGALRIEVTILNSQIDPISTSLPEFELRGDIYIDRTYEFVKESQTVANAIENSDNGNIDISWASLDGAEEYDLEWTFYDLESDIGTSFEYTFNQLFRNNSTRITTDQLRFSVPNLYPEGYFFHRVRGVRYVDGVRQYSKWHIDDDSTIPLGSFIQIKWHQKDINWQSQVSFAEEGKHVPSVNYFDGSLRQRQSVTFSNAIGHPILQQNIYDYLGRPTISVMASPDLLKERIEYNPLFAASSSSSVYTKENLTQVNGCLVSPPAMDTDKGAANYFSKDNSFKEGMNAFIPEADGFVFSTNEYMPDLTGRMRRQSGVGNTFQLDSDHETKYFYGKASQEELDLLFDDQVGVDNHYQKNMVQDPNGQLSINYIDAHGRTIATALAGDSPSNTEELDSKKEPTIIEKDLLNNIQNGNTQISTYTLTVSEASPYTFNYHVDPKTPEFACLPVDTCYDCVYDLKITVDDNCGNLYNGGEKLILKESNITFEALPFLCSDQDLGIDVSAIVPAMSGGGLPIGEYKITKELSVSQAAAEAYLSDFLSHATCLPTYDNIYENILINTDFSGCENAEAIDSVLNECEMMKELLLIDVQPGGLSAPYERDMNTNELIITEGLLLNEDFRKYFTDEEIYENGQEILQINMMTTEQFIEFFQPEWAENLIVVHEQNGCYEDCLNNINIVEANLQIRNTETYADAIMNGFIDSQTCLPDISIVDSLDCNKTVVYQSDVLKSFPVNLANWIVDGISNPLNISANSGQELIDNLTQQTEYIWMLDEFNSPYFEVDAFSNINFGRLIFGTEFSISDFIIEPTVIEPCNFENTINENFENLDPFQCVSQSIIDIIEQVVYCNGEIPCFTQFGKGCPTDNNLAWVLFKNIYLTEQGKLLSDQYCNFESFMTDYINNNPEAFENPMLFAEDDDFNLYPPDPEDVDEEYLESQMEANELLMLAECATNCEAQAVGWLSQISPCLPETFDQDDFKVLEERLIAVCTNGCNALRPLGASTCEIPTSFGDTSFEGILISIGLEDCDIDCNPKMITSPPPHSVNPYFGSRTISLISQGLDEAGDNCFCDNLQELESCYDNYIIDNNGEDEFGSLSAYLDQFASINIDQSTLDTLSTYCVNECNALPIPILLPPYLECGVCKTPEEVNDALSDFDATGCTTLIEDDISDLRALHLNSKFGYNLSSEQVKAFLDDVSAFPNRCHLLCPSSFFGDYPLNENECEEELLGTVEFAADIIYENKLDSIRETFVIQYMNDCIEPLNETFVAEGTFSEHHFTLYYYDQAGNLVQTIAPEGTMDEENYLKTPSDYSFKTNYKYNTFNQVVEQLSPDTYIDSNGDGEAQSGEFRTTKFWYDNVGRVVASQDGRQEPTYLYSYTLYDPLGRIIEVGEIPIDISANRPNEQSGRDGSFTNWVTNASGKKFVTKTFYDREKFPFFELQDDDFSQDNLRNRVVSVTYEVDDDQDDNTFDSGTHYNYDVTGNVKTLVQEITALHEIGHGYKRMDYEYDYISGNVNAVYYQKDKEDQYTHRYLYDENNRLTDVKTSAVETGETSRNQVNPSQDWHFWDNEASYEYYDHGPMARAVIGEEGLQGCDYAYNLQGWIKGVNSSIIDPNIDMGGDGLSLNTPAKDACSYTIGYFNNDYQPIDGGRIFEANYTDTYFDGQAPSLYNGNIRNMVVDIDVLNQPIGYTYNYDQLHRIKSMDSHKNIDINNNSWDFVGDNDEAFKTSYSYDANGNINTLDRNGSQGAEDVLRYTYDKNSNRLATVIDQVSPDFSSTPGYISDHSRYAYDGAGNLIRERRINPPFEDVARITWTPYGKVDQVTTPVGETHFGYGPDQNRISKTNIREISGTNIQCLETRYTYLGFQLLGTHAGINPFHVTISGLFIDGVNVMSPDENGSTTFTVTSGDALVLNLNSRTDLLWAFDNLQNLYFTEIEGGLTVDPSSTFNLPTGFLEFVNPTIGTHHPFIEEIETQCGQEDSEISESSTYYIRDAQGNVMGVYEVEEGEINWKEQHIYGSSRLGLIEPNAKLQQVEANPYYQELGVVFEGQKRYEMSNHLGNVLAVINDRKQKKTLLGTKFFEPTIISAQDYFPFGQEMGSDRNFSASSTYRYGFNGKEKDEDGEFGNTTHYDYGFRIYNPSIAKFLSVDPLTKEFPYYTPYQFASNTPIQAIDLDGLELFHVTRWYENDRYYSKVTLNVAAVNVNYGVVDGAATRKTGTEAVYGQFGRDVEDKRVQYTTTDRNGNVTIDYDSQLTSEEKASIDRDVRGKRNPDGTLPAGQYEGTSFVSAPLPPPVPVEIKKPKPGLKDPETTGGAVGPPAPPGDDGGDSGGGDLKEEEVFDLDIAFGSFGSNFLNNSSASRKLQSLVDVLLANPNSSVHIQPTTNLTSGTRSWGLVGTKIDDVIFDRGTTVGDYLINQGVSPSQIQVDTNDSFGKDSGASVQAKVKY